MTELERLEKEYENAKLKFNAATDAWSITHDAAMDAAEAVRATATRATEGEWYIAVREMRVAREALEKAKEEQTKGEV